MGPAFAGPISDRKWGRPSAGPILRSSLIGRTIGRILPDMVVSRETWWQLKGLDYSEIFKNGKVLLWTTPADSGTSSLAR